MSKKFSDYMAEVDDRSTDDQRAVAGAFDANYKMVYLEHFGLGDQPHNTLGLENNPSRVLH